MALRATKQVEATDRQREALDLRRKGHTYDEIARAMGYTNKATAHRIVCKALRKMIQEPAEDVLKLELDRLDAMIKELWGRRATPEVADRILKIMDRRAKYLGLDAPAKSELTGANGGAIQLDDATALRAIAELQNATKPATEAANTD